MSEVIEKEERRKALELAIETKPMYSDDLIELAETIRMYIEDGTKPVRKMMTGES